MYEYSQDIYAHSVKGEPCEYWETLDDHLLRVAELCEQFAASFGEGGFGRVAGLLHDAGKLRAAFQKYIRKEISSAEHSICGSALAIEHYGSPTGRILAYTIAGHHGGLPDCATLTDRLRDAQERQLRADMAPWPDTLELPTTLRPGMRVGERGELPYAFHFLTRMLFSALVDADFLATEGFYRPRQADARALISGIPLAELASRLDGHLGGLVGKASPMVLARRAEVLESCRRWADEAPGVFSLTVPTGGGKTLSSLAFAMGHAKENGLERVIYVIPYTSIIEQTAQVFRDAFGDLAAAVVEHHSAAPVIEDRNGGDKIIGPERLALAAAENWDAPVIVTTSVQFFESLYASKPSRCRKLHNIARSVVVLDEVQALPLHLLQPCLAALRELAERYGTSLVLCSATLPDWQQSPVFRQGFRRITELAPDVDGLFADLARVRCESVGMLENDKLAAELAGEPQVLCIVDARPQAAELYRLVHERRTDGTFHLSAAMCPAHRRAMLAEVKDRLERGTPCRLIATTVIEAGVDVDFPVVWRALAGIDSLVQAAGRCNRNGRLSEPGRFVIFDTPHKLGLRDRERRRDMARTELAGGADPLGLETVRHWFERFFNLEKGRLDQPGILARINERGLAPDWDFQTIAGDFHLISDATETVIVPWQDITPPLVEELNIPQRPVLLKTLRALQQVSVAVYPQVFAALKAVGALRFIGPEGRFAVLENPKFYDPGVGLTTGAWAAEDWIQ